MYKKIRINKVTTRDQHRLIMENHLGRSLTFNEVIHHKDGNTQNNNLDNLVLMTCSEHARFHYYNGDYKLTPYNPSEEERISMCYKYSVVTEDIAKRIKHGSEKASDLCKELGVSKYVINRIRHNKSWKHI